jgi:hypothetical protein
LLKGLNKSFLDLFNKESTLPAKQAGLLQSQLFDIKMLKTVRVMQQMPSHQCCQLLLKNISPVILLPTL